MWNIFIAIISYVVTIYLRQKLAMITQIVKFDDKNGEVFISAERLDNEVVVKVKDTGCGLSSDVLPKLFTKFMTKSDRGTGLGLYIQNISSNHTDV
ncbi:MAG TPA: ATP-binding protein [Nitrososphaera sp.]